MKCVSPILRKLGCTYELYRIYMLDHSLPPSSSPVGSVIRQVTPAELEQASHPEIRSLSQYCRPVEAFAFGAVVGGEICCACWYWAGKTYAERGFWPLMSNDAKLIQVTTAPDYRGRGLATAVISTSALAMMRLGYTRLFARIWHSTQASIAAFEKAGWTYHAFVLTLHVPVANHELRLTRKVKRPSHG